MGHISTTRERFALLGNADRIDLAVTSRPLRGGRNYRHVIGTDGQERHSDEPRTHGTTNAAETFSPASSRNVHMSPPSLAELT
jgi:hypothetical protein